MMLNDSYFLKQVIFRCSMEIDDLKSEMVEAAEKLYPAGCKVLCKRGKGKMPGSIFGRPEYKERFEVRVQTQSGEIHWVKITDIEPDMSGGRA